MMSFKHTSGPWEAVYTANGDDDLGQFGVIAKNQPDVADLMDICTVWLRGGVERTEANANLIAAAPNLLSVVNAFIAAFERGDITNQQSSELDTAGFIANLAYAAVAIANGEGDE